MLTVDNVVPFLVAHSVLGGPDLVAIGVQAMELTCRNINLRVTHLHGDGGYFVKQPDPGEPSTAVTLRHEAHFYRWRATASLSGIPDLVGTFEGGVLVLALVPGARTLRETIVAEVAREAHDLNPLGWAIGRTLATIHSSLGSSPEVGMLVERFPTQPPWILEVHRPTLALLTSLSEAQIELICLLQGMPLAMATLDDLRTTWHVDGVIHADVKADNVLVTNTKDGPTVVFVDWELVQRGERAWDVGGLLHDLLLLWVFSMPMGRSPLSELVSRSGLPLDALAPLARGFWDGYGTPADDVVHGGIERSMLMAGARLLQSVYEQSSNQTSLSNHALALTQLSLNILQEPRAAAAALFGLDARSSDGHRGEGVS